MCGNYYEVPKEELEKRIKEIVKKFDMDSFQHQKIENLSTGQYQRTSIARCLVHNPKYYILDEATSGLDVISSQVILDFIKEETGENGILLLDDVMSELDSMRREYLIRALRNNQIFITTTDIDEGMAAAYDKAKIIQIENGKII